MSRKGGPMKLPPLFPENAVCLNVGIKMEVSDLDRLSHSQRVAVFAGIAQVVSASGTPNTQSTATAKPRNNSDDAVSVRD